MMYAQYCRIESRAGGCNATPREMIRSARKCLSKYGKARASRDLRHVWLRELLAMHREANIEYMSVLSGRRRKTDV
jgi:hypothetical protein